MSSLKVSLLGKFNIDCGKQKTFPIRARKVQELFVYLLIFRNHVQPRESLSEVLWSDRSTAISRKNLRQTLWHLQCLFKELKKSASLKLVIDDGWIGISLPADFWLDIAEFEGVFDSIHQKPARELSPEDFQAMEYVVNLYRGDLLEGWYQDWCVFERERFQVMHLMLLDKLTQYCEIHQQYEAGLAYGWQILRHDQAYERAHRKIMRLYFLLGDRTQAIHQYQRCAVALSEELGVEPSQRTKQLYEQIRLDAFMPPMLGLEKVTSRREETTPAADAVLQGLQQFAITLKSIEAQIQREIMVLESMLSGQINQSSR